MFRIIESDWFTSGSHFTNTTFKYFRNKEGKIDRTWSINRDDKGIQINPF